MIKTISHFFVITNKIHFNSHINFEFLLNFLQRFDDSLPFYYTESLNTEKSQLSRVRFQTQIIDTNRQDSVYFLVSLTKQEMSKDLIHLYYLHLDLSIGSYSLWQFLFIFVINFMLVLNKCTRQDLLGYWFSISAYHTIIYTGRFSTAAKLWKF